MDSCSRSWLRRSSVASSRRCSAAFAVITAAILPLGTIAALRFELAIPFPQRDRHAWDLASLGLRICAGFGLLELLITWFARSPIASALGQGHAVARRSLLQAAATVVAQTAGGFLGLGAQGLALGLAIGQGGVATLALSVRQNAETGPDDRAQPPKPAQPLQIVPLLLAPAFAVHTGMIAAPLAEFRSGLAGHPAISQTYARDAGRSIDAARLARATQESRASVEVPGLLQTRRFGPSGRVRSRMARIGPRLDLRRPSCRADRNIWVRPSRTVHLSSQNSSNPIANMRPIQKGTSSRGA